MYYVKFNDASIFVIKCLLTGHKEVNLLEGWMGLDEVKECPSVDISRSIGAAGSGNTEAKKKKTFFQSCISKQMGREFNCVVQC